MPAAALRRLGGPRWPSLRGDPLFPEEEAVQNKLLLRRQPFLGPEPDGYCGSICDRRSRAKRGH
jgi:hypothetical protein